MDKKIHFYVNNQYKETIQVDCKYNLYKGDEFGKFTIVSGTSEDETQLVQFVADAVGNQIVFTNIANRNSNRV